MLRKFVENINGLDYYPFLQEEFPETETNCESNIQVIREDGSEEST